MYSYLRMGRDILKYRLGLNSEGVDFEHVKPRVVIKRTPRPDSTYEDREMCTWAGPKFPYEMDLPESLVKTVYTKKVPAHYAFARYMISIYDI